MFWFIVACLAGWRITSIIVTEKIFYPVRQLAGQDDLGSYPDTLLGYLFGCFWCMSVWVGLLCTVLWVVFPYALAPFAISALSVLIEEHLDRT